MARLLGDLLRADQFPRWLVTEAVDDLVAIASANLAALSSGQFDLTHDDGDFYVIDHADADARRSVRTLSGGETFQASLALALALSSQISALAAAGAARLDSIFLDEGFGTLDAETLEVVATTLETLAQGDRMVGVVTHVAALAERVPVRFRVTRDARTSTSPGKASQRGGRDVTDGHPGQPGQRRDHRRAAAARCGSASTAGTRATAPAWNSRSSSDESTARVDVNVEVPGRPLAADRPRRRPARSRRRCCSSTACAAIEARVWIDDEHLRRRRPATRGERRACAPRTRPAWCAAAPQAHLVPPSCAAACSPSRRTPATSPPGPAATGRTS